MLVYPGFGSTCDWGGVYCLHPGLELLLEVVHDLAFGQSGVDLATNLFEATSTKKVDGADR